MKLFVALGIILLSAFTSLVNPPTLDSANLTAVKDTLQTSRLSWSARVEADGTDEASSAVQIQSAPATPYNATSTANLNPGDTILINANSYTVVSIVDADQFTVNPVIGVGDADDGDPIQLKKKSQHVVTFTTASAVANGSFRILLPADATTPADGNVDDGGFDYGTGSIDVTASNVTGYTFGTGTSTAAGGVNCVTPANYHCFDIGYTGAGAVGATITINIGTTGGTNTLLNPTEVAAHTIGTADTYDFIVRNFASGADPDADTPIDASSGRIAFIESVRVTATVDPTISMTICGADTCTDVEPGDTVDGETLSSNTGATSTSTSVALGILDLAAARIQAQKIGVATNGAAGYALTAIDDGNLRFGSNTIDDNVTPPTSPAVLNTPGTEAYGIHPCGTHVSAATWGTGSDSCTGGATTNEYSGTDTSNILTLVNYTTGPTNTVYTYVNYKANISATTAQGSYSHLITYIATATF